MSETYGNNVGPILIGDRPMPHSIELERSLLACLMKDPETTADILDLDEEAFYQPDHRHIFHAMAELAKEIPAFDIVMLSDHMDKSGMLGALGGIPTLMNIQSSICTSAPYMDYLEKVQDYYQRRQVIVICTNALGDGYEMAMPTYEIMGSLESKLLAMAQTGNKKKHQHISEATDEAIARIKGVYDRDIKYIGLSTGFPSLDAVIGGCRAGELIVLAARPSIGKTALAVCILRNMAAFGHKVRFFGAEMDNDQIAQRMLYSQSQVSSRELYDHIIPWETAEARLREGQKQLDRMPFFLDDIGGYYEEFRHRIRVAVRKDGVEVVAIDYLQLINLKTKQHHQSRENEVAYISKDLKSLARELHIPIIVLAQLNRIAEGKVPNISELRESGAVEQDADIVALLYRGRETDDDATQQLLRQGKPIPTIVKVGKDRNWSTGIANLDWYPDYMTFANHGRIEDEDVPR